MKIVYKRDKEREKVLNRFDLDDEGLMIYDEITEDTHILNETAQYIFDMLEVPMTLLEIEERFVNKYVFTENEKESLTEDLDEILEEMVEKKLISSERIDV